MIFSAQKLKNKILRDKYNSLVFEKGRGRELYLVGGYLRDVLRGVRSKDRDYIISGDIRSFVKEIRKITGGSIVDLRKEHMIRIALEDGVTLDFSKPDGTIKEDLSKRDFTINAIAWSPDTGIKDPYNGLKDIRKRKIRSLSEKNLVDDPLRMLRAYRFAAEFEGYIEKRTRNSIKMLHNTIKEASSERITSELFNLLNLKHSAKYLKMALYDGLLTEILSLSYSMLAHNIKSISIFEQVINEHPYKIQVLLKRVFSQNLIYKGLLCLELLLNSNGSLKPLEIPNIKMSNKIIKHVELSYKGLSELKEKGQDQSFDIFSASKEASMDAIIITGKLDLIKKYNRFKKIWKKGAISSEEIMEVTGVKTGPVLRSIITKLKRDQFEGRIKSKRDAIRLLS